MPTNDQKPTADLPTDIRRVLLGTDLSRTSELATDRAFDLAHRHGAELLVVSVIDPKDPPQSADRVGSRWDEIRDRRQLAAQALVARGRATGVTVWFLVWTGEPGESIVSAAEAEDVDLVVVGTHGRGPSGACSSAPSPSTSCATRHAPCSSCGPPPARRIGPRLRDPAPRWQGAWYRLQMADPNDTVYRAAVEALSDAIGAVAGRAGRRARPPADRRSRREPRRRAIRRARDPRRSAAIERFITSGITDEQRRRLGPPPRGPWTPRADHHGGSVAADPGHRRPPGELRLPAEPSADALAPRRSGRLKNRIDRQPVPDRQAAAAEFSEDDQRLVELFALARRDRDRERPPARGGPAPRRRR